MLSEGDSGELTVPGDAESLRDAVDLSDATVDNDDDDDDDNAAAPSSVDRLRPAWPWCREAAGGVSTTAAARRLSVSAVSCSSAPCSTESHPSKSTVLDVVCCSPAATLSLIHI